MIDEGANIDYGMDDLPIEEAAQLPNDDYLSLERVEHEHPSPNADMEVDQAPVD